jgi:hypothetical protein
LDSVHNQQVVVAVNELDRCGAPEVDIGFVDDHDRVRVGLGDTLDGVEGQQATGGRVRVGENDAAVRLAAVVGWIDGVIIGERHGLVVDAVEATINRVEAVRDIRKEDRRVVLEQRHEYVRQNLVRAVADEHLLGLTSCVGRWPP